MIRIRGYATFIEASALIVAAALGVTNIHSAADAPSGLSAGYTVSWRAGAATDRRPVVVVEGLGREALDALRVAAWPPPSWRRFLAVYTDDAVSVADAPPMAGAYAIASEGITFRPAYPLDPGRTYYAVFHPKAMPGTDRSGDAAVRTVFTVPAASAVPSTMVTRIYPGADVLPENLLKFYIYFSAPMRRGRSYEHVRLMDGAGAKLDLPFLDLDEELWDPTMTRLTLFIDPGRIKRELLPRQLEGPVFVAGQSYRLEIDPAWLDGNGNPLRESFQKSFTAGPADNDPPLPATWVLATPRAGSTDPLRVTFTDPMDHALARRMITVRDESGARLQGEVDLAHDERQWIFSPAQPWAQGDHALSVASTIEDLAGNNIGKPFEVDIFGGVTRRVTDQHVQVRFTIR